MKWGHPAREKVVLFVGDIVCIWVSVFLGAFLRFGEPINTILFHKGISLVFSLNFLSLFYIFDLYNLAILADRRKTLMYLCPTCGVGALVPSTYLYFAPPAHYGRSIVLLTVLCIGISTYGWRRLFSRYRGSFISRLTLLVLGTGRDAEMLRSLLRNGASRYRLAGFIRIEEQCPEPVVPPEQVLGDSTKLRELVAHHDVHCLVLSNDSVSPDLATTLTRLKFEGVTIYPAADFYMRSAEELPLDFMGHSWLWFAEGFDLLQARVSRKIKRLSDLFLASLGLILTLPLSLLTALAIKLESRGPIIYRQQRVGWNERPFDLLKFRSMHVEAESDNKPRWACAKDSRVTRVGSFIRKLHIDEIPQMINVLKGEMSFIGPRPERQEFVDLLKGEIPFYHLRHYIRPGITGWAQVNNPYAASVEDARRKLQFDLYYILHASPLIDLRILLRTARVVFFRTGSR